MQIVPLELSHNTFFCPVTGVQLLSPDGYHCSAATLFHFIDMEGGHLVDPKPEIEVLYNEALEDINKGLYENYDFKFNYSDEAKAFEILVYEKLKQENNYVLFEICTTGYACGAITNTVYIGIDMNYQSAADLEVENAFDFESWFPDFENYETVLLKGTQTKPSLEGYALFMEDTMGCGGFYFLNSEAEWETLLPALLFLDYINQSKDAIPAEQLSKILKVYFNYFNAGIYDELPEHFTPDLNELLQDYKIIFFGKTNELFEPNTDFSADLIEEFEGNPIENSIGFLSFLSCFSKY
jgi:hypothetical protein